MTQLERFFVFLAGVLTGGAIIWVVDYYAYLLIFKQLIPPV